MLQTFLLSVKTQINFSQRYNKGNLKSIPLFINYKVGSLACYMRTCIVMDEKDAPIFFFHHNYWHRIIIWESTFTSYRLKQRLPHVQWCGRKRDQLLCNTEWTKNFYRFRVTLKHSNTGLLFSFLLKTASLSMPKAASNSRWFTCTAWEQ